MVTKLGLGTGAGSAPGRGLGLGFCPFISFETCQMENAQKEVSGVPKLPAVNQGILQRLMQNYR